MTELAPVRHATVDGLEVAYRRAGSGRTVVLLHGIPTSSRLWDEVGADLAADFDVVAPDMVGYGESAKPLDRDVSITAQGGYLVGLLDALGLDRVVLVGHDIGGGAAQVFAVEHGDRLDALMLVDAVSFDSWPVPVMRAVALAKPLLGRIPPAATIALLERLLVREAPFAPDPARASVRVWGRDRAAMRAFLRNVAALDSRHTQAVAPRLSTISVPAHVVWGARDRHQPPEWAPRLRDAIPGATLELLDSSHWVPWERPAELAREVRRLAERAG